MLHHALECIRSKFSSFYPHALTITNQEYFFLICFSFLIFYEEIAEVRDQKIVLKRIRKVNRSSSIFLLSFLLPQFLFNVLKKLENKCKLYLAIESNMKLVFLLTFIKTVVPGEPQDVRVNAINSTALHVQWKDPLEKDRNGIIMGYHIHVQETKEEVSHIEFQLI